MAEQDDGGPAMMPVKPDGTGMTTAQAIEIALMSYRAGRLSDHIAAALDRAGWALVPKEPTTDMCVAAVNRAPSRIGTGDAHVFYQAMLAAAPKEPGQ